MAMRNFWLEASVDGRENNVTGGPRSNSGQMDISVYQRVFGSSVEVVNVNCVPEGDQISTYVTVKGIGKSNVEVEDLGNGRFRITSPR